MNAVVKLTGYAKTTERLETIVTVLDRLVPFGLGHHRRRAGILSWCAGDVSAHDV